jgi:hypothetical protein
MMETVLLELLHRLEAIEEQYGGLGEAVQEAMEEVVFDGFIRPDPGFALRHEFGTDSEEADALVRDTLAWFIPAANQACQQEGLTTFHERLAAFQNLNVRTESTNDYNDYFGWYNPTCFDEDGNFKGA